MNEKRTLNNIENDDFNLNREDDDYTNLITRLKEISKTILLVSGWFLLMALAIFWRRTVFPVLGCATINALCPIPIGETKSIILIEIFSHLSLEQIFFLDIME